MSSLRRACAKSGSGCEPHWPRGSPAPPRVFCHCACGPLPSRRPLHLRLRPGSMSRIPPSLLYLTIYNPTIKPALLEPDNEDAEEQAHILFYTAREHAVSRDRILRQVGLAKALVNFSE